MASLNNHKGLDVLSGTMQPGGQAISENFERLADWHPRSVWDKTANPTVDDDGSVDPDKNYQVGSYWLNTSTNRLFVCTDNASGAAVWRMLPIGVIGGTNTLLYTTSTDSISSIATANDSVLVTNGSGRPSWSATLPTVSGANLTALDAANIVGANGLPDAVLSRNVPVRAQYSATGISGGVQKVVIDNLFFDPVRTNYDFYSDHWVLLVTTKCMWANSPYTSTAVAFISGSVCWTGSASRLRLKQTTIHEAAGGWDPSFTAKITEVHWGDGDSGSSDITLDATSGTEVALLFGGSVGEQSCFAGKAYVSLFMGQFT